MDPNNNQPINTNPLEQAAPSPVAAPPPPTAPPAQPAQTTQTTAAPQNPPSTPKSNKKIFILLALLLLLAVGMVTYVLFAKNQMNKAQKAASDNSNAVLPTPTAVPTLAPEEDLEVASPEADLIDIEADLKGL